MRENRKFLNDVFFDITKRISFNRYIIAITMKKSYIEKGNIADIADSKVATAGYILIMYHSDRAAFRLNRITDANTNAQKIKRCKRLLFLSTLLWDLCLDSFML